MIVDSVVELLGEGNDVGGEAGGVGGNQVVVDEFGNEVGSCPQLGHGLLCVSFAQAIGAGPAPTKRATAKINSTDEK